MYFSVIFKNGAWFEYIRTTPRNSMSSLDSVTLLSPEQVDANAEAERVRLEQEEEFLPVKKRRFFGRCPHGSVHYCGLCLEADLKKCHSDGKAHGHSRNRCECGFHYNVCDESVRYLVPIGGHFEVVSFDEAERKRKYIDWEKVSVFGIRDDMVEGGYLFHPFDIGEIHDHIFSHMTPNTVDDCKAYLVGVMEHWDSHFRVPFFMSRALEVAAEEGYPSSDWREHLEKVELRRSQNAKSARDYRERRKERVQGV
jgi:hypothetical protein